MTELRRCFLALAAFCLVVVPTAAWAGFGSTEVFLPAVGRIAGNGGAQFFTTVWATNLTGAPETLTFQFLKQGQSNVTPASFQDTLAPGETKVYENVVETKLGLTSAIGAARVTSTGEIFVSERIFNQAPGADLGDTAGLFFAAVPKSFSISAGQSASIQGLNQGGAEDFRYNFALVETGGGSPTVNVQVFDGSGALLGQKAFLLSPFEQLQPNVEQVVPGFSSVNARLTATVTVGTGSVLLAGAQLANVSQDSSGFEMTFRDDLLGGGGTAGVTSLNALTGALTLTAGNGISITPAGSSIAIAFTGGGSSGLTSVTHDVSLAGAGTGASPLGIANGQVVRSVNGLHDAVTLTAGSNVTITPSGNSLTIAAAGGSGGGLASVSHDSTLTGDGTGATPLGISIPLELSTTTFITPVLSVKNTGAAVGIEAITANTAVFASSQGPGPGVKALTVTSAAALDAVNSSTAADSAGVRGTDGTGTSGQSGAVSAGVLGESKTHVGVQGRTDTGIAGVRGLSNSSVGVLGKLLTGSAPAGELGTRRSGVDYAGYFTGDVHVTGTVSKGAGSFQIDDPIDPYNKYLYHSFVESPDMMNVYNGEAMLDANGVTVVELPRWFQALNRDFRYQLTALDTAQPALHVARRIENNRFTIAGGVPGASVSWQVTGIRHDAFANAHRIPTEIEKPAADKGLLLYPHEMGEDPARGIDRRAENP